VSLLVPRWVRVASDELLEKLDLVRDTKVSRGGGLADVLADGPVVYGLPTHHPAKCAWSTGLAD